MAESVGIQPMNVQGQPAIGQKKRSWLVQQSGLSSLNSRVVFTVGEHKGRRYDKSALEAIVEAFEPTLDQIKPRVKLGHDEAQSYARIAFGKLGTKDDEHSLGLPALGYVDNIRLNSEYTDRNGKRHEAGTEILADFVNLDSGLHDDLMALRYPERSAEIIINYRDKENAGKVWPYVLQNVAFLGDELPAVRGMAPLVELNSDSLDTVIFRFCEERGLYMEPEKNATPATLDDVMSAINKLTAAVMQLVNAEKKEAPDSKLAEKKPEEMKAAVPAAPAVPKKEEPEVKADHSDYVKRLESQLAADRKAFSDFQRDMLTERAKAMLEASKQEAERFAESISSAQNPRIPVTMRGDVARLIQRAPDVEKFSDSAGQEKSYKAQLMDLLGKVPLLTNPDNYGQRAMDLHSGTGSAEQPEVVKLAEDKAKEYAKQHGLPYAQALYEYATKEMSGQDFIAAVGLAGNNGVPRV